ncbi:DNA-binding protein [Aliamphritea ceti]|uniref:DNA-binding protein n=1 Tax=Aliamphritea ceti TaxID=1524258 RepID=UPI0021C31447|nr:DNA-binding protein [Aliamphritea ceti]
MSEHDSTYQKVFIAADELLALGQRPTQQSVRDLLGTGSLTTINKALNAWWQSLGERLQMQRQRPDIPEQIFNMANQIWEQALAHSAAENSAKRQALELEYADKMTALKAQETALITQKAVGYSVTDTQSEQKVIQLTNEKLSLSQHNQRLEGEIVNLREAHQNAQQQIIQQDLRIQSLEADKSAKEQEVQRLHSLILSLNK